MFTIRDEIIFTREVKVNVPDGESVREESFRATFRVLSTDVFATLTTDAMTDFLRKAVVKLNDLVDENGGPVGWSEEVRDRIIVIPHVRSALLATYVEAMGGDR